MNEIIKFLINDEVEAIKGYDKAIQALKDKPEIVSRLSHIRDEEVEHIAELNELIFDNEEIKL